MRAAGDQAKTTCGNLKLCAGLETSIEEAIHDVGQRRLDRVKERKQEEEEDGDSFEEGGSGGLADSLNSLRIETAGTEEEAAEELEAAL